MGPAKRTLEAATSQYIGRNDALDPLKPSPTRPECWTRCTTQQQHPEVLHRSPISLEKLYKSCIFRKTVFCCVWSSCIALVEVTGAGVE